MLKIPSPFVNNVILLGTQGLERKNRYKKLSFCQIHHTSVNQWWQSKLYVIIFKKHYTPCPQNPKWWQGYTISNNEIISGLEVLCILLTDKDLSTDLEVIHFCGTD